jgi:hypothetical protein
MPSLALKDIFKARGAPFYAATCPKNSLHRFSVSLPKIVTLE